MATVFAFSKNTENSFSRKSTKVEVKTILEQNTNFNITSVSTTRGSLNDLVMRNEAKNNLQKEEQIV